MPERDKFSRDPYRWVGVISGDDAVLTRAGMFTGFTRPCTGVVPATQVQPIAYALPDGLPDSLVNQRLENLCIHCARCRAWYHISAVGMRTVDGIRRNQPRCGPCRKKKDKPVKPKQRGLFA